MKSLTLVFFTLSIVCIIIGYMEIKIESKRQQKKIEYRFVPREIYDTQFNQINLENTFIDMFGNNLV
jgi:hypothetical protein